MVGITKIQRGNAGYWLAAVAEGGEDYYTKPGEAPGEWIGELAADLGLSGQVDAESYSAVLEGTDPTSGTELLKRPETRYRPRPDGSEKRIDPVLGFDVRFSCPKSVSIVYALGDAETRERVIAVVNEAVRQGLSHLEHEACFVQRGKGGERIEPGSGFVGMAFRHRMSRAGDPALHVHVVISNLTRALSDGKWLSLASPKGRNALWPHGKSAGVVFQAALRAGFLREFGLDFDAVTNGYADLSGFDRDVIDALSTRAKEIREEMERYGADSVEAAQVAAYRTRAKKDYGADEDDRRGDWIETAEPFGVSPESVGELVAAAQPREPRQVGDADVDAALAQLEQSTSHFDRRELLWALCDQLPEGADRASLTGAVDRLLASERIVRVHRSAEDDPLAFDYFTTPYIAALEKRFIDAATEGAGAGVAIVSPEDAAAVLDQHDYLGTDQREMALRLTTGGEAVAAVAAWPGTGKTTALRHAREIWEQASVPVVGCAVAWTATHELRDAGIANAVTIRRLLMRAEERRAEGVMPLAPGTVVVVDEASMVSTPDLEALRFLSAECGGKLVLIGDPQQIGAIGPGGLYGHWTRLSEPATLTTIRRQRDAGDRRLVALVHEGRGSEALDLLRTQNRIVVGDNLAVTLDAMVTDWSRDYATGADVVMIARRNRDVDYLNDQARELRREAGALGAAEVIVGERAFAAGDRVQTRINREGVVNRERWEVIGVDPSARTIALRRVGGDERTVRLAPSYLNRRRQMDGGPALEHAYALTNYGAQGKTVDRAYPLLDGGGSLEQELVALSRGREVANVYAVASSELSDIDLGPGTRELSDELHDIRVAIEREGNDFSASEISLRQKLKAYEPDELANHRATVDAAARAADPVLSRADRLERDIRETRWWVDRLRHEREAIERIYEPPAGLLSRARDAETAAVEQRNRAIAERASIAEPDPSAPRPAPRDPESRLEASLVELEVNRRVSARLIADQIEPSSITYRTLGPCPHADPDQGLAWHQGARALHAYRIRYGILDEAKPLGGPARGASARAERARAQRQIEAAQRRLGRSADRTARRALGHSQGIGR